MSNITEQVRQAIENSITHWEEDILKPLKEGKKIIKREIQQGLRGEKASRLYWEESHTEVPCYSNMCPLCAIVADCNDCLYLHIHGQECCAEGKAWTKFHKDPCVETAREMINDLKYLLL